eukprot:9264780-Ditylum_brightwellii.AAC.1
MDVIRLLKAIKGCIFEFDNKMKTALALYRVEENFFCFCQTHDITTPNFFEKFNNLVGIIEQYGGMITYHLSLVTKWSSPGGNPPMQGNVVGSVEGKEGKGSNDETPPDTAEAAVILQAQQQAEADVYEDAKGGYLGIALIKKSDLARFIFSWLSAPPICPHKQY